MELEELRADLQAFADEEGDVLIDPTGSFMLMRGGREITGQLIESPDGRTLVRRDGTEVPYRTFLVREVANLHQLAERLVSRRPPIPWYVDPSVRVETAVGEDGIGSGLATLRSECEESPAFAARVTFITADAGHGKTALLRKFQSDQALAFMEGRSSYLFWHVDLQGRQLVRLSEALMGDLGDLRIAGLWMPGIIRLLRSRSLVLGIDGFDELAAEQGSTDALGALASLVAQLQGRGTIVAAARRTFFDTDDYLRRAGVLGRAITSPSEFNQLKLLPWDRSQATEFLRQTFASEAPRRDAEATYESILAELGGQVTHPMLTRPFLLTQIARAITRYGMEPTEFFQVADDTHAGVATVVEAFIKREVAEKWRIRETGEPYLSEAQHMQLLADVAEEMYRSQKDRLDLDVIETLAALLMEQWTVDASLRPHIAEMVRMHVLLVSPDGESHARAFDHPEFLDYFIAFAMRSHLERAMVTGESREVAGFLSIAQLTDSTARYVCGMLDRQGDRVARLLGSLEAAVAQEWKPTFLQLNVGTLLPYILSDVHHSGRLLEFREKAVYSSVVFEYSRLEGVRLSGGSFINVSLTGVRWRNVTLAACALGELTIGEDNEFTNVVLDDCTIDGLRLKIGDEEVREYAPNRIRARLVALGLIPVDQPTFAEVEDPDRVEPYTVGVLRRFLRQFSRTTVVTDEQLRTKFRQDAALLFDRVIPVMERHEVVAERPWRGAGTKRSWMIKDRVDDVLAAEEQPGASRLGEFWREVRQLE